MNRKEFLKRIEGVFRPEAIRGKKAIVVGTGSGGSRAASELGRLGISLILVERPGECLEEHNIVRHLLGYDFLGSPKAAAVARHIAQYNPSTAIKCTELNVTLQPSQFAELVRDGCPDVILTCTDNEQSKHAVDAVSVRFGIPTVGAGVYDGGVGGEVYLTRPESACYGCIANFLRLERHTPEKSVNIDYNNLNLDETRSTCALNLHIEQIALIQSTVALNLLLAGETDLLGLPSEVNLMVFANRRVPGAFERPLHCDFYSIPKNPACLVCGRHNGDGRAADQILASL